ncbi:hypothetical protein MO867_17870, partial [Microbulbifer sp. OS29]
MKETSILFNGDMVRAILDGRKAQTRRLIKPQPFNGASDGEAIKQIGGLPPARNLSSILTNAWQTGFVDIPCPYGEPGDRLWGRETFHIPGGYLDQYLIDEISQGITKREEQVCYRA